jgi:alpha-beta hydrolase superfamily lysophospholipase
MRLHAGRLNFRPIQTIIVEVMKRVVRLSIAALLSAILSINLLAFMQARAMTRFTENGDRTARPEQLSVVDKFSALLSGVNIPRPINRRTPADLQLTVETHRIRSADGVTLDAWFLPGDRERSVVALFHGYAASKSSLLTTAQALHDLGYAALLVDFYGSGGSSGSGTTIGFKEADDVAATVEYVRQTWPGRKIILYGVSMGGAAVLRAVAVHGVAADGLIIEAGFDRLLNTGKNRFRAMGLPASPFAELLLFWGGVQNGFDAFAHNPVDYARAVKQPALILHGEKDVRATPEEARTVAAAMNGNGRVIVYDGVPHMSIVQAKREEWSRDVSAFMESLR